MNTMQICPDWSSYNPITAAQFHALAPNKKPWWNVGDDLRIINEDMGLDGRHSTIIVIDDGCQLDHENFMDGNGETRIIYAQSFVQNESVGTGAKHGTSTAGCAGGRYTSLTPAVRLVILKGLDRNGSGSSNDLTRCTVRSTELLAQGVINTPIVVQNHSYGGNGVYQPQEVALQDSDEAGITNVVSAGNSGGSFNQPTCGYPGTSNHVLCIGAIGPNGLITVFSSRCKNLDLAGPGADIYSSSVGGGYSLNNGTSFSGPLVSSLVVLLQEWMLAEGKKVLSTAAEFTEFFRANAIDVGQTGHDWEYGWGVMDVKTVLKLMSSGKLRYV